MVEETDDADTARPSFAYSPARAFLAELQSGSRAIMEHAKKPLHGRQNDRAAASREGFAKTDTPSLLTSPRVAAQRALVETIHNSPRVVSQWQQLRSTFGQRMQLPGEFEGEDGGQPTGVPAQMRSFHSHPVQDGISSILSVRKV